MIYILALGVGFKCPRKIHLNTQWGRDWSPQILADKLTLFQLGADYSHHITYYPQDLQTFLRP